MPCAANEFSSSQAPGVLVFPRLEGRNRLPQWRETAHRYRSSHLPGFALYLLVVIGNHHNALQRCSTPQYRRQGRADGAKSLYWPMARKMRRVRQAEPLQPSPNDIP